MKTDSSDYSSACDTTEEAETEKQKSLESSKEGEEEECAK